MRRQSTAQIVESFDPTHFSHGYSSGCADRDARSSEWILPARLKRLALELFPSSKAIAFLACVRPGTMALKPNMSRFPREQLLQCRQALNLTRRQSAKALSTQTQP